MAKSGHTGFSPFQPIQDVRAEKLRIAQEITTDFEPLK